MTGPGRGEPHMIFTVAIDGPAAAGKGTIARALAAKFGFAHLDTGLLYRATARRSMSGEDPVAVARDLRAEDLQGDGLRSAEVGQAASRVAALPEVRQALLDFQQRFSRQAGGAILDGRDIGTVICPLAEVKLFVTASDEVRAGRRCAELRAMGADVSPEEVLADLKQRDARDAARDAAPLRPAADALLLDTTELSIDAAVDKAARAIEQKLGQGR